ncbi:MAG: phage holin family protein [Endomicrobia bacterium]|nr:phage holin family protein [Bacillota bacterium]MCL1973018.1 phage holin family protein [Endomicrobiia bacterium]
MKNILIRLVVNSAALLVAVNIISGINIPTWGVLIATAIVIGLLNAVLKPVLILLTLPINILTLGIFTLFINAFLFYLTSKIIIEFTVGGFWDAFWGAVLFSIVSIILNVIIGSNEMRNLQDENRR